MSILLEWVRAINFIDIFVYGKNEIFLPNYQHLHGSASYDLPTSVLYTYEELGDTSLYRKEFEIIRTKWRSLDMENERCSQEQRQLNTEKCITRYCTNQQIYCKQKK